MGLEDFSKTSADQSDIFYRVAIEFNETEQTLWEAVCTEGASLDFHETMSRHKFTATYIDHCHCLPHIHPIFKVMTHGEATDLQPELVLERSVVGILDWLSKIDQGDVEIMSARLHAQGIGSMESVFPKTETNLTDKAKRLAEDLAKLRGVKPEDLA